MNRTRKGSPSTFHIDDGGDTAAGPHDQYQALRNLWSQVLMYALADATGKGYVKPMTYLQRDRHRSYLVKDAKAWFASEQMHVGSFLWICGILGLNPDAVRERIAKGAVKLEHSRHAYRMKYEKQRMAA